MVGDDALYEVNRPRANGAVHEVPRGTPSGAYTWTPTLVETYRQGQARVNTLPEGKYYLREVP